MDPRTRPFLGTLLRRLIDHLDSAVEERYVAAGLPVRPRYTPVVRALLELGPASIQDIARHAHLSHSAASQTVAQMTKAGLVRLQPGADARTRVGSLTPRALAMVPRLERMWETTNEAAAQLEGELHYPLSELLQEAFDALEKQSFLERIECIALHDERRSLRPARAGASRKRTLAGRRR